MGKLAVKSLAPLALGIVFEEYKWLDLQREVILQERIAQNR
jgi:hypothetical protein